MHDQETPDTRTEGGLHPDAKALVDMIEASGLQGSGMMGVEESRAAMRRMKDTLFGDVPAVDIRALEADGPHGPIPLRLYRPLQIPRGAKLPTLIYLHGGGWVMGDLDSADSICCTLANDAEIAVVSIDYRLAPEHKFPAAVEDSIAAVDWIVARAAELGINIGRLAIGGESAGGNLAAVVALHARDQGRPELRSQILIYPITDASMSHASYSRNAKGYVLTAARMQWFRQHYLKDERDSSDWRVSPLRADTVAGVAPAYIITCGFDPLADEGAAYAKRLLESGVAVTHRRFSGQIHGFISFVKAISEAKPAIEGIVRELRERLR